jgi:hypothetical protein
VRKLTISFVAQRLNDLEAGRLACRDDACSMPISRVGSITPIASVFTMAINEETARKIASAIILAKAASKIFRFSWMNP